MTETAAQLIDAANCPFLISDTTSRENAENVVKPPKKPVMARRYNARGSSRCSKSAHSMPIATLPAIFTPAV